MTQEELDRLLSEWQIRLRLQDWRVIAKIVPQHEIDGLDGQCDCFDQTKEAVIRLSMQVGGPGQSSILTHAYPSNWEFVLVHELLELHFHPFKSEKVGPTHDAQEQAINLIVGALVESKRGNGHSVEQVMHEAVPLAERI